FGEGPEGQPCAHGVLGAMTGSGKSSLYHTLILGLAVRYSPAELRMYLIDGKYGVEFKPYQHLPHAEVVSLRTSAELSRSVLGELSAEMTRRNELFARHGVAALPHYRAKGQPEGPLPRILLIADEYQQLFEHDRDGAGSALLAQLAAQGRSAGIHLLLASQRFGAAGMINQAGIFGNLHLRLAMQMAESDIRALTEFGQRGKALILATCNLPGKIVLNERAGDENANLAGKAAYLPGEQRDRVIAELIELARGEPPERLPQRVIFNGTTQPDLLENPQLAALLAEDAWRGPAELELLARQPAGRHGWGVADWYAAEHPSVMWLGQEFNVRGQARLVLRRRVGEHVALVGANAAARYGMLAGMLASVAVACPPAAARFVIADRAIPGAAWSGVLAGVCDDLLRPAGFEVEFTQQEQAVPGLLAQLIDELERRSAAADDEAARRQSIYLILSDIDRIDALRRQADAYGMTESPAGEQLRRLYAEGAPVGIHLILSAGGARALAAVIDEKRGLPHFQHRVALQLSEDDSFAFVRSRRAALLQSDGPQPVCALYVDLSRDQPTRFKPYSIETDPDSPEGSLREQLRRIGARLRERKQP
ncbi:MAG TPA: FtsK/SpoIIIE domain-containing protein, partial [Herpetosiphonaceae bacterium]